MIDWAHAKDVATVVGGVIALFTLFKGILEYIKQGSQKRAEQFGGMRRRFKESESFKEICGLLETDDQKLEVISFRGKRDFLGFFEEIALMTNSKIIRKEVAHTMLGKQALLEDVNRDSIYWQLFRDFVERMKAIESSFRFATSNSRF